MFLFVSFERFSERRYYENNVLRVVCFFSCLDLNASIVFDGDDGVTRVFRVKLIMSVVRTRYTKTVLLLLLRTFFSYFFFIIMCFENNNDVTRLWKKTYAVIQVVRPVIKTPNARAHI